MRAYTKALRRQFLEKTSQISGYINISRKAGYLIIGSDKLKGYNKKLYLALYDTSAQKNTLKVVEEIKNKGIPIFAVDNLEELTKIKNCKIVGIKNKDISEIIANILG